MIMRKEISIVFLFSLLLIDSFITYSKYGGKVLNQKDTGHNEFKLLESYTYEDKILPEDTLKNEIFMKWCKNMNIYCDKVGIKDFVIDGLKIRGLIALENIEKNEIFIKVPLVSILHSEIRQSSIRIDDDESDVDYQDWVIQLTSSLLHEKFLNKNSKFMNYINILPTQSEYKSFLPLYWNTDNNDCILNDDTYDSDLIEILNDIQQMVELQEASIVKLKNAFKSIGEYTEIHLNSWLNDDTAEWALNTVRTRNLRIEVLDTENCFNALIPLVDLMNHHGTVNSQIKLYRYDNYENNVVNIDSDVSLNVNDCYIGVSYNDIHVEKGQQLFLNYRNSLNMDTTTDSGDQSNSKYLLLNYGFIPSIEDCILVDTYDYIIDKEYTTKYLLAGLNLSSFSMSNYNLDQQIYIWLKSNSIQLSQVHKISINNIPASLIIVARLFSCGNVDEFNRLTVILNNMKKNQEIRELRYTIPSDVIDNHSIVSVNHELTAIELLKKWMENALNQSINIKAFRLKLDMKDVTKLNSVNIRILENIISMLNAYKSALSRKQVTDETISD